MNKFVESTEKWLIEYLDSLGISYRRKQSRTTESKYFWIGRPGNETCIRISDHPPHPGNRDVSIHPGSHIGRSQIAGLPVVRQERRLDPPPYRKSKRYEKNVKKMKQKRKLRKPHHGKPRELCTDIDW